MVEISTESTRMTYSTCLFSSFLRARYLCSRQPTIIHDSYNQNILLLCFVDTGINFQKVKASVKDKRSNIFI